MSIEAKVSLDTLKLALEALEYFSDTATLNMDKAFSEDAITALRQAIEQAQQQEPVVTEGMVDAAIQAFWGYENKKVSRTPFRLAIEAALQDKFCDANCVWTDHHPDCAIGKQDRHALQAKGEHPAPCARFCEANAFQIEIRSLKAKLEQAQKQEPAYRCRPYSSVPGDKVSAPVDYYTSPPTQKQEPVAKVVSTAPKQIWLDLGFDPSDEDEISFNDLCDATWSRDNATGYGIEYVRADLASPPQRQPLTDEQIGTIATESQWGFSPHDDTLRFARAIEAAHGIKGEA